MVGGEILVEFRYELMQFIIYTTKANFNENIGIKINKKISYVNFKHVDAIRML